MSTILETLDFKQIRTLFLQLGPDCNMSCRHCHQTPDKSLCASFDHTLSSDALTVIEHFIQYSQKPEFVKQADGSRFLFSVSFYGGETLLHWDIIKSLVLSMEQKFHYLSNHSFRFSLISNGLALTQEMVDFFNQYDVVFSFSYDAPYPFAVRGYVSDSVCALVNKIKSLKIVCCGSAYNCDPLLAYRCLKAKFPNAIYTVRMEVLRTFDAMPSDIDNYDVEKLRYSLKKLFIAAKLKDSFASTFILHQIQFLFTPQENYFHMHRGVGYCVAGYREFTMNLDGSVLFCYNSFEVLGHVAKNSFSEIRAIATDIWRKSYDPLCDSCECRDVCYWGCMIIMRDEHNHMYNCDRFRIPFFRMLKEMLVHVNEPLAQDEIDWYRKQELLMDKQVQEFLAEPQRYLRESTFVPFSLL